MDKIKKKKKNEKGKFGRTIKKISNSGVGDEKYYFVESMFMLISSGMTVFSSLDAIEKEMRSKKMKRIVNEMKNGIDSGKFLWEVMQDSFIFSDYVISLVRIGERTGELPRNLSMIASSQQKERIFYSRLRSAMIYPVIVLVVGIAVALGISWFILPRLAMIFSQLNVKLPWMTKFLILAGEFLGAHGRVVIPSFVFSLIVISFFLFFLKKTRFIGQAITYRIPGVGRLVKEAELARAGFVMGSVMKAGLTVVDSLGSLSGTTNLRSYEKFYTHLKNNIEDGKTFEESFSSYKNSGKLIPFSVIQIIVSAEKSGNLPEAFSNIGDSFENKTEITTKNLTAILEPVLLVGVWLVVVFISLSVILPIYSLIGGFNQVAYPESSSQTTEFVVVTEEQGNLIAVNNNENNNVAPNTEVVNSENNSGKKIIGKLEVIPTGLGYLNVRNNPSIDGEIIGKVFPENQFEYLEKNEEWYLIILSEKMNGNDFGWINSKFVKLIEAQ